MRQSEPLEARFQRRVRACGSPRDDRCTCVFIKHGNKTSLKYTLRLLPQTCRG
jgi:hypothetical protein